MPGLVPIPIRVCWFCSSHFRTSERQLSCCGSFGSEGPPEMACRLNRSRQRHVPGWIERSVLFVALFPLVESGLEDHRLDEVLAAGEGPSEGPPSLDHSSGDRVGEVVQS